MLPKSIDLYELKKELFVFVKVDIQKFIEKLHQDSPTNEDVFVKKPPKVPKLKDPVIDPNETWGEMFWRVSEFKPPPLVKLETILG